MDIGCYPIKTSRMAFGEEPARVSAAMIRDPRFGNVDVLTSAILDYPSGQCVFTCSTQLVRRQSMQFFGTTGRIELEIPFTTPAALPSRIQIDEGVGGVVTVEEFAPCDQYTIQGDLFSRAIREGGPPPVPLEDSLRNMTVIDALFRSAETGQWVEPCSAPAPY